MKIKFLLAAIAACLITGNSYAGGFQLYEYSAVNQGRSFAGTGVAGDDYSAIAYNPAGMTLRGTGVQSGSHLVCLHAKARGHAEYPNGAILRSGNGNVDKTVAVPFFFGQYAWDNWRFGLGVTTPFGMSLTYNDGWFGKDHSLLSKLKAIDISPSVAYQINDQWSVGASFIVRHVHAQLTNTSMMGNVYSNMKALSTDYTYQVGIMYEPVKDTRFGLSYRHKCTSNLNGSHNLIMPGGSSRHGISKADILLPEHIQFSAFHRLNNIDLTASLRWTRWSRFELLAMKSNLSNIRPVEEAWKNTWTIAAGLDYHVTDRLTLRTGFSWDSAGVPDDEHRTARVPDSDRIISSVGVSYTYDNWQIDAAYSHLFHKSAHSSHNTNGSTLNADYSNRINLIGLQLQYSF